MAKGGNYVMDILLTKHIDTDIYTDTNKFVINKVNGKSLVGTISKIVLYNNRDTDTKVKVYLNNNLIGIYEIESNSHVFVAYKLTNGDNIRCEFIQNLEFSQTKNISRVYGSSLIENSANIFININGDYGSKLNYDINPYSTQSIVLNGIVVTESESKRESKSENENRESKETYYNNHYYNNKSYVFIGNKRYL